MDAHHTGVVVARSDRRVGAALLAGAALCLAPVTSALGQQAQAVPQHRVYFEALGNGIVYSVNYERSVSGLLSVRVGAGGLAVEGVRYALGFAMPNVRVGRGTHSLQFGVGAGVLWIDEVWVLEAENDTYLYGTAAIAYEFRPGARGIFLRAAVTPVFTTDEIAPWVGFGLGYAF